MALLITWLWMESLYNGCNYLSMLELSLFMLVKGATGGKLLPQGPILQHFWVTFYILKSSEEHKYTFPLFSLPAKCVRSWNHSSWRSIFLHWHITMAPDDLATQCSRASATMVLMQFSQEYFNLSISGVKNLPHSHASYSLPASYAVK